MPTVARSSLLIIVVLLFGACPAAAENQMGYRLMTDQEVARLRQNHGVLGLDIERAQRIRDSGLDFDLMRVKGVRRGSPGDRAGLQLGDVLISLDGQVFSTVNAMAGYIGSRSPGSALSIDYMPKGQGPREAQRVTVVVGSADGRNTHQREPEREQSSGMSMGKKLAIGAGAVALFGCYEMGCFSSGR